jgi:quercetin dioxygenase-like cupin family protein
MTSGTHRGAYLHRHDEGESVWFADSLVTVKASAAATAGSVGVLHVRATLGCRSPLHQHGSEDESWYVLAGELRFWLGDVEHRAGAGDFVFGPRGVPHRFQVESDESEFLIVVTPGGFEGFVRDTGWPATRRDEPYPTLPQHTPDEIEAAIRTYGLSFPTENAP